MFLSRWQTVAKAVYDDLNLYVRFESYFPDASMLEYNKDKTLGSATPIWENDCVQLFIQTEKAFKKDKRSFYQVIANVVEYKMTKCHYMKNRSVNIEIKCKVLKNKWISTMKIPLKWFYVKGDKLANKVWNINFGRTQRYPIKDVYSAYSSWAVLPPGTMLWFLQPNYFGKVKFE